jgi:ABC-type uncharacterized transport system substrate-binding protein
MRRRELLSWLSVAMLAKPAIAPAEQPKVYRVGWIAGAATYAERFRRKLAELGYIEGRNFELLVRFHHGHLERLPELASELASMQCDVIVATGPEATLKAAAAATRSIPIVIGAFDYDPVALGYASGLRQPGGIVTGVFLRQVEITAKRIELLKAAMPALAHAAVFSDRFTPDTSAQMHAAEATAERIDLRVTPVTVPGTPPYDYATAIETARARGAGAVLALMSPAFFEDRERFVHEMSLRRMPASFGLREFADLGGLMSYGANLAQTFDLIAGYVDKILKGNKPADLPIMQPTRFELVINLKTAKALGLTVPQSLLARADEVIE